jgi:hypothetical protein
MKYNSVADQRNAVFEKINVPDEHLKTLYVFTRLAVLKLYRKSPAVLVLMAESMFKFNIRMA